MANLLGLRTADSPTFDARLAGTRSAFVKRADFGEPKSAADRLAMVPSSWAYATRRCDRHIVSDGEQGNDGSPRATLPVFSILMNLRLRWWIGFGIGAVTWIMLWIIIVIAQLGAAHPHNQWITQSYAKKIAVARSIEGPKIVVVGGSAALFGIDSGRLEAALGRRAVNLGVTAGIGPHAIAAYADSVIGRGDLVLMPLEYALLTWGGLPNHAMIDFALEYPDNLSAWPVGALLDALWRVSLQRIVEGFRGLPDGFAVAGVYGPHNIDARGDQIGSGRASRSDYMIMAVRDAEAGRYGRDYDTQDPNLGLDLWSTYWQRWKSRGAQIIVFPQPMQYRSLFVNNKGEKRYYDNVPEWVKARGVAYVGDPFDSMLSDDNFFDSPHHLHDEARENFTDHFLRQLSSHSEGAGLLSK